MPATLLTDSNISALYTLLYIDMRNSASWLISILMPSVFLTPSLCSCSSRQATSSDCNPWQTLLIGSYAPASEEGIRVYSFNQETGESQWRSGLKGIDNPSFLTIADDGTRIYAVGENAKEQATVHLLLLNNAEGTLSLTDTKHVHEADPCHLSITPDSTHLVTANYSGGSITIFPLREDGTLEEGLVETFTGNGPDSSRQEATHLHCIYFSPDRKWLMANDLGSDCIHMYPLAPDSPIGIDTTAERKVMVAPGSGPRHAVFDKEGRHLYLLNELKGDVVVWTYEEGELKQIQSIQADSVGARGSADIHLSPDGKYLYASNRLKADGIAIFQVDSATGLLTHIGYQNTGAHPRNFAITPNGKFLLACCRDANRIEVYQRDPDTGMLKDTGKHIDMPKPVVVKLTTGAAGE